MGPARRRFWGRPGAGNWRPGLLWNGSRRCVARRALWPTAGTEPGPAGGRRPGYEGTYWRWAPRRLRDRACRRPTAALAPRDWAGRRRCAECQRRGPWSTARQAARTSRKRLPARLGSGFLHSPAWVCLPDYRRLYTALDALTPAPPLM